MMKKFFTLIELITVIVVLGILAAIVIPNISSFKEEAKEKAILADARNIQTAVDMYGLDFNGATPTKEKATLGNPQIIELYGMQPNYLRDTPKDNGAKFWLDSNNTVWASMVDAPTNVNYANGTLTWDTVDGAELYKIYKTNDATSATDSSKIDFVETVEPLNNLNLSKALPELTKGTYLVTAIDSFEFESAPTKVNTKYVGYNAGPDKDFVLEIPKVPANQKPIAIINMSPENNLNTSTTIGWSYANSTDPDGHAISNAEWRLNDVLVVSMPDKLPEGNHKIEIRVQDEKGLWSNWVSKEIIVNKITFTTAVFSNAGATGHIGPTQSQLDVAYVATELKGNVTSQNGIQLWTVPATGKYKIQTFGAEGAPASYNNNNPDLGYKPGLGAIIQGDFLLNEGDVLKILVGQKPNRPTLSQGSGGGGGGTFVSSGNNTALIVAGGGNGQNWDGWKTHGPSAQITNSGQSGGNGNRGTGGGGFFGNGLSTNTTSYGVGGFSFLNGGLGAYNSQKPTLGAGGFGGGGIGYHEGGGGGGYTGGSVVPSNQYTTSYPTFGAGSYNSGTNQSNTVGHTGHGKVIITFIP